jgi:hypothetical protein
MRKRRLGKDEKREVTPEFVNMSKEILYPQIQGVTENLVQVHLIIHIIICISFSLLIIFCTKL